MLSQTEKTLLLALREGRHFKDNPVKPTDLVALESQDANPAGRNLVALKLAAIVRDSARPNALLLRITDAGISEADKLQHAERRLTFTEHLKAIPIGKGAWDILKIAFGAALGVLATKFFGQ